MNNEENKIGPLRANADGLVDFTFRVDAGNDGSFEVSQQFVAVDRNDFETGATINWVEFDASGLGIALSAATTHTVWWNSDNPISENVASVRYNNGDQYPDGQALGNVLTGTSDTWFGVTTVPEASEALVVLLGMTGLLGMRRRKR